MQHSFIGRKRELLMLGELFKKKVSQPCSYPRETAHCKNRLAQEFANKTPHYVFSGLLLTKGISAADQKEEFARNPSISKF